MAGFELNDKLSAALSVTVCVPGGAIVYFTLLYLLRFEELATLKADAPQLHAEAVVVFWIPAFMRLPEECAWSIAVGRRDFLKPR